MSSELCPASVESSRDGVALDRSALEQLYVKLEKPMFNVVYRWLWNAGDAQDVVQEAFLRIWKARDTVDPATATPLLYRTALNLASNRRRSARLWRFLGIEAASEEPTRARTSEEALAVEQDRARVRRAIEALPERLRQVLMLSEYTDLTQPEIGLALGIPSGTVGSRRHAALAELSRHLGAEDLP
jgi:RNA polymerase sigma-70 factor, ECF subfamily